MSCYWCQVAQTKSIRRYMSDAGFNPIDPDPYAYLIAADYYEERGEDRRAYWLRVYESRAFGAQGGELKLQW